MGTNIVKREKPRKSRVICGVRQYHQEIMINARVTGVFESGRLVCAKKHFLCVQSTPKLLAQVDIVNMFESFSRCRYSLCSVSDWLAIVFSIG